MVITEAIIQRLEKAQHSDVTEHYVDETLPINDQLTKLLDELRSVYLKASSTYGTFNSDTTAYSFSLRLQSYYEQEEEHDLVNFSKATCSLLKARMETEVFATGGYIAFIRYQDQGADWLMVLVLKLHARVGIDTDSMQLNENYVFDIRHLHEAARVDLGKWRAGTEPYLSFAKGRGDVENLSRYFRLALGCTDFTDSKANTAEAIKALHAYCENKGWNSERSNRARKAVYEHFHQKKELNEPVNLVALSAIIDDQSPNEFAEFVAENNYSINTDFAPHANTFRVLKRIQKRFGTISVAFDVSDVIDQKVDYDAGGNRLYITDPPQSLIEAIQRYKDDEPADQQA